MLTNLLRRLQARPAAIGLDSAPPPAPVEPAVDEADPARIEPALLTFAFVRHLLGSAPDAPASDGLAEDILARLAAHAAHLDVARLPRLPALVPQMLSALQRDESDPAAVAALLARDPTLATAVGRAANSAQYRRGAEVASLPQAIAALGPDALRYVVLTTVVRPILQADPSQQGAGLGERLSRQADARIWLCGALAPMHGCDAGDAQFASVVASTGVAALMRMMPRTLMAQAASDPSFAPRFLELASDLSARAATHWRLGEGLRSALQAMLSAHDDGAALGRTLLLADRLSMLHSLRVAGGIDDVAHVSATADARRRDVQLLAALPCAERETAEA